MALRVISSSLTEECSSDARNESRILAGLEEAPRDTDPRRADSLRLRSWACPKGTMGKPAGLSGLDRCGGRVGDSKTLATNNVNRNCVGNPIPAPSTKVKSVSRGSSRLTKPGFETQGLKTLLDARPSGFRWKRTAEPSRAPAHRPAPHPGAGVEAERKGRRV